MIGEMRKEISEAEAEQIYNGFQMAEGSSLLTAIRCRKLSKRPPTGMFFRHGFSATDSDHRCFRPKTDDHRHQSRQADSADSLHEGINGVQSSAFATSINFEHLSDEEIKNKPKNGLSKPKPFPTFSKSTPKYEQPPKAFSTPNSNSSAKDSGDNGKSEVNKTVNGNVKIDQVVVKNPSAPTGKFESSQTSAPVVHLTAENRNLLVDVPYGAGQIVFLSDPYIVANGGINLVDNAQLAINIVASRDGIIAFDEYHQGYGANENRFLQFFAGTPVVPIFLQTALLIALIFFSQSRRFARAVPEPEPNRLSKLEYVSAMAELQQRTKGYDLAIENIYTEFGGVFRDWSALTR